MHDRLTPSHIPTAIEIAALIPLLPIEAAADLIEQYARTAAAGARITATEDAYARLDTLMRNCIGRVQTKDEYAETIDAVAKEMRDA